MICVNHWFLTSSSSVSLMPIFQEAHREEMLVNRLMRQSQQERRIAVQLMQVESYALVLF